MADRLSPARAADYIERQWHLRVSAATVRRWATSGSLPAQLDGRRVLIHPDDLHRIFDARPAGRPAQD